MEPWKNTEIDARFIPMLEEIKESSLNVEPQTEEETAAREQFDAMCREKEAQFAIFAIEKALQKFIHPRISFDDEMKSEAVRDFSPLLIKYGVMVPEWLGQYEAELMALKAAGTLGYNALCQAKRYKQEDALIVKQQEQAA
ncbi:hypothetical protein [Photobacterium damselae]|uniref:Uncharacterized protein n=1 Tax=Photobacterium damselae TaxID=38293 RepID=A0ABD6X149_PHODM|nr:hypothetical protein [Photobacterium damselae]OBU38813.1 hypothetical protein AYY27_11650 [Photobacterium damselae]ODA24573.1 hypothetical protein A0J46_16165 [Photobacterium damselae subsp. damselae]PSU15076.1 hypothetical protein CTM90_18240 [Photobacterium damselae]